jgi:hypothetical protein
VPTRIALPLRFTLVTSVLFLLSLTAGCGGGGGGGGSGGSNTSPPTVLSTSPSSDAEQVASSTVLVARFSEDMAPSTVTAAEFLVTGPGNAPVAGTVSYDESNYAAVFTPSAVLASGADYSATLTTDVEDVAGHSMIHDYTWSFTTGLIADTTAPTVTATNPPDITSNVALNQVITAVFSEQLNSTTTTDASFTLTAGAVSSVAGTVVCPGSTMTFTPTVNLAPSTSYTARITTLVRDLAGNALANDYVWSFLTGASSSLGPAPVVLGTAGNFVILAKSTVTTTGTTAVLGDIGLSPAAASYFTGFSQTADASTQFATAAMVTGKMYASNYGPPTPTNMTTAVLDMQTAYVDAAGRSNPSATGLGAGNINGMTLAPGLYKWGTGLNIPSAVTLEGGANDVWIFQIAQNLTVGNGAIVTLSGGAQAKNIFWQVAGQVTLGTTSDFKGIVLCKTAIILRTGAVMHGRALAQTAVTLDAVAISAP